VIDHTTELYCIIDDLLKAKGHREDARRIMSDAEVLTTALVSAHRAKGDAPCACDALDECASSSPALRLAKPS